MGSIVQNRNVGKRKRRACKQVGIGREKRRLLCVIKKECEREGPEMLARAAKVSGDSDRRQSYR